MDWGKNLKSKVDRSIDYAFRMTVGLDAKNLITTLWPQQVGPQGRWERGLRVGGN